MAYFFATPQPLMVYVVGEPSQETIKSFSLLPVFQPPAMLLLWWPSYKTGAQLRQRTVALMAKGKN